MALRNFKFSKTVTWVLAVTMLLWAFGLWTTRLTDPFVGRHDNITAWQSISARNYLRYGYFRLGFLHTYDIDPLKTKPEIFYNSTAPLPAVFTSFMIVLFGDHESSGRIGPMFMTMISGAALFTLVRIGFGRGIGLLALLLFLTTPMVAYYGQMIAPEEFFVPFFLLMLLVYHAYLKKPTAPALALMTLLTALITLSSWASVFAVAGLSLHALMFAPKRLRLIAAMTFALVISNLSWLLMGSAAFAGFWSLLAQRFEARTSGSSAADLPWNGFFDYLARLWWTRMRIRFTEALFILAGIGGAWLWFTRRGLSPRQRQIALLTGVLLIPALLYLIIFQEATWIHDYITYYFAPPLAILGALALVFLFNQFRRRRSWQRFGAGLTLLILVVGLVFSTVRWTRALYLEREDFALLIAPEIQGRVPAGTPLYSNLPFWPAVWYYSQRDVKTIEDLVKDAPARPYIMTCERDAQDVPIDAVQAGVWTCWFAT